MRFVLMVQILRALQICSSTRVQIHKTRIKNRQPNPTQLSLRHNPPLAQALHNTLPQLQRALDLRRRKTLFVAHGDCLPDSHRIDELATRKAGFPDLLCLAFSGLGDTFARTQDEKGRVSRRLGEDGMCGLIGLWCGTVFRLERAGVGVCWGWVHGAD